MPRERSPSKSERERSAAEPFDELIASHAAGLYRLALALVRDPVAAEDLVQETFLRALERQEQLRDRQATEAWLQRILHNLAHDRGRRLSREIVVDELPVEEVERQWQETSYTVDSHDVLEQAQTRKELEEALVRLPFIYRAAVVMHDVYGWTTAELAERLEIGLPAAKQRLRRGRMMLVTALAEAGDRRAALEGVALTCWDARGRVSDYINGELDEQTAAGVERHLEDCPTCPPLYAALVGVQAELVGLRDPDSVIPPALIERLTRPVEGA